jgi:alcohol dehydrogenase
VRAVVYNEFGHLPVLRDVPEPDCPADGAVIQVEATGVCRSDWHAWLGHDPDVKLPHIPGHEYAGTVLRVGAGVRSWTPGQRVTVPFVCACGSCPPCREGNGQVCVDQTQPGFTHPGSFAEQVAVRHADVNLVALPDAVDAITAAALGCRFATAYRAVTFHGAVSAGDWVAVHGCGGVGLSAVMIAAAHGARVVAVDTSDAALELAVRFGAVTTLKPPAANEIRSLTDGGVRVSIEALGRTSTYADSLAGLRLRGRHVQVGLLLGDDASPAVDMGAVIAGELEIVGSHGMAAGDYPPMLAEIADGLLRPCDLVARTLGLDQAPAALAELGLANRAGITVVVL